MRAVCLSVVHTHGNLLLNMVGFEIFGWMLSRWRDEEIFDERIKCCRLTSDVS